MKHKLFFRVVTVILLLAKCPAAFSFEDTKLALEYYTDSISKDSKCIDNSCPYYKVRLKYPVFSHKIYQQNVKELNDRIRQIAETHWQRFLKDVKEGFAEDAENYAVYLSDLMGSFEIDYNQNGLLSLHLDIRFSLPLGNGYPERSDYFFNYDIKRGKNHLLAKIFEPLQAKSHWENYLKARVKNTVNTTKVKGFTLDKTGVNFFCYGSSDLPKDEGTQVWVAYQDFWRYFKPRAPYQFLQAHQPLPLFRKTHQVHVKETVSKICRKYKITRDNFRRWNNIEENKVYANQMYYVAPPIIRDKYLAQEGDGIQKVCKKFQIHVSEFLRWNQLEAGAELLVEQPYAVGPPLEEQLIDSPVATKKRASIKAKRGDTISEICLKYNIPSEDFRRWNKLSKRARIYAGKRYWVAAPIKE